MKSRKRKKESRLKEWVFVLIGIVVALASAPLFFLLVAMVAGGTIAMLVSVIEIYLIVAIGSFSLACRIFGEEPPEPSDILRIIFLSGLPANLVVGWAGLTGWLAVAAAAGVAMVVAALLCMLQLGMPVWPSIAICVAYNVFAAILTVVGVILLGLMFVGYMAAGSGGARPAPARPGVQSPFDPAAPPGRDSDDFDDQTSIIAPRRWLVLESGPQAAPLHGLGCGAWERCV